MLADFSTPGVSRVFEKGVTTPSRRGTLEDNSLASLSPARTKASTITSPKRNMNSSGRTVTIYDQIGSWFNELIQTRKFRATVLASGVSASLYIICLTLLQLSLWSPLQSIADVISTVLSAYTYVCAAIVGLGSFAVSWLIVNVLLRVDQLHRVSKKQSDGWIAFVAFFVLHLITSFCLLHFTGSKHLFGLSRLLVAVGCASTAFHNVFTSDYQLSFQGNVGQLGLFKSISSMLSFHADSVLAQSWSVGSRAVGYCMSGILIFGLSLYHYSSVLLVFDPSFYYTFAVILCAQAFFGKFLNKLAKQHVMQPLSFAFPPPYFVHSPTPEQTRTLNNVLDTSDKLLALFAFFDLRRVAWMDAKRRADIFSLSQPGGHPRNWSAVASACIRIIDDVRTKIEVSATQFTGGVPLVEEELDDGEFVDRQMLLMPHKARTQMYSTAVRQRHRVALRPPPPKLVAGGRLPLFSKLRLLFTDEISVVPRHETVIATLAIESLYKLVVESYHEDRYGVVMKDLNIVMKSFVALSTVIDKFTRVKASVVNSVIDDSGVKQLDTSVQSAILRIHGRFGSHLNSIGLSKVELNTIQLLCKNEL